MASRLKHTGTFRAASDDGLAFTVLMFTQTNVTDTLSGRVETAGNTVLQTSTGLAVNRREKGVYEIPEWDGLVIRSADSNAP